MTGDEVVRVTVPGLIRLSEAAAGLGIRVRRPRARSGGAYLSAMRGRGMEFDEVRPYQPGDDVRNIEWRVTARTGRPHTKLFREERERPVFVWVDYRRPMFFATRGAFKSVVAARAAALLAWHAHQQGDRVGGVVFSEHAHRELEPRRGKASLLLLLKHLAELSALPPPDPDAPADQAAALRALRRLRRVVRPGSLIFLVSDFRHLDEVMEDQLGMLAAHNDVVLVFVYDPLERDLPPPGQYRVTDGRRDLVLDTFERSARIAYHAAFEQHLAHLRNLARRHGASLVPCSTAENPLRSLSRGLGGRGA